VGLAATATAKEMRKSDLMKFIVFKGKWLVEMCRKDDSEAGEKSR
jgi:hypothetical protein